MTRWTAQEFWDDRGDVAPTRWLTANDALREAFLAGATEAEIGMADPQAGDATVYVRGLFWRARRKLAKTLNEDLAPIGTKVYVKKLKGQDDG